MARARRRGRLFGGLANGPVEVPTADPRWKHHTSQASADYMREQDETRRVLVIGRLFDLTKGWAGQPPGRRTRARRHAPARRRLDK